jgi:adenosylmethionine-8-amino-7-oxononanoate aminotransferase
MDIQTGLSPDTTCGAAVACLGHKNERVKAATMAQMDKFSY